MVQASWNRWLPEHWILFIRVFIRGVVLILTPLYDFINPYFARPTIVIQRCIMILTLPCLPTDLKHRELTLCGLEVRLLWFLWESWELNQEFHRDSRLLLQSVCKSERMVFFGWKFCRKMVCCSFMTHSVWVGLFLCVTFPSIHSDKNSYTGIVLSRRFTEKKILKGLVSGMHLTTTLGAIYDSIENNLVYVLTSRPLDRFQKNVLRCWDPLYIRGTRAFKSLQWNLPDGNRLLISIEFK